MNIISRKITCLILALSLLALAGCGGSPASTPTGSAEPESTAAAAPSDAPPEADGESLYKVSEPTLPGQQSFHHMDGKLYYLKFVRGEAESPADNGETSTSINFRDYGEYFTTVQRILCRINPDGTEEEELTVIEDSTLTEGTIGFTSPSIVSVEADGSLWMSGHAFYYDAEGVYSGYDPFIVHLTMEGEELALVNLREVSGGKVGTMPSAATDAEGRLHVVGSELDMYSVSSSIPDDYLKLYVFGPGGELLFTMDDGLDTMTMDLVRVGPYVGAVFFGGADYVMLVDAGTGGWGETYEMPKSLDNGQMYAGDENYDVFYKSEGVLYGHFLEEDRSEEILNFADLGIDALLNWLIPLPDGAFLVRMVTTDHTLTPPSITWEVLLLERPAQ